MLTSNESHEFRGVLMQDRDVVETNLLTALDPPKIEVCDNNYIFASKTLLK